ncbi:L-histidine N(alpha)-methyltransferase [Sphingomonas sp. PR090111-T3T-6A]|uniref:L-histidine N(alpha)-methyltransferase n=1 Tax=Sphingomonas sp. PR090111-T3T-6A TaxID=685778 RepID=UPI00036661D6|nr:L-histidine N(alpha)-methyltransferase [Sphingomonas sp. PR090111-T3T-6A]
MAMHADLKLVEQDEGGVDLAFRAEVLQGLSERQKAIPARWFYDMTGSELFEEITRLPEYYPSRVETRLLETHGGEIAELVGPGVVVVEFGSGSSVKTPLLLRELTCTAYVPLDISGEFLRQSSRQLAAKFPELAILPIEANFMQPVRLPGSVPDVARLGFFPGSTIGNMVPQTAIDLLRSMRDTLGDRSQILIGIDRHKDVDRLVAAYDDAQGVTARFNLNLLDRINRELEGTIPCERFRHAARWNPEWSRIEMHLEALDDLSFTVCGRAVRMRRGETIHTENSHKYTPDQARLLLQASGWTPIETWSDPADDFMLVLADATLHRSAP